VDGEAGKSPDGKEEAMSETQQAQAPLRDLNHWHTVLIVDDDSQNLTALRRVLQREPYDIVTTGRPALALEWLERKNVSLVISDQRMPEMAGDVFLEGVWKKSPRTERLLLTAFPESLDSIPNSRKCLFKVRIKPWDEMDLKRTIRSMLHDREDACEEDVRSKGTQSGA
jgi:DNA-binding NtrC family response regulator